MTVSEEATLLQYAQHCDDEIAAMEKAAESSVEAEEAACRKRVREAVGDSISAANQTQSFS